MVPFRTRDRISNGTSYSSASSYTDGISAMPRAAWGSRRRPYTATCSATDCDSRMQMKPEHETLPPPGATRDALHNLCLADPVWAERYEGWIELGHGGS